MYIYKRKTVRVLIESTKRIDYFKIKKPTQYNVQKGTLGGMDGGR